jgi:hypothetical protein
MTAQPQSAAELLDLLAEKDDVIQELTDRLEDIAEKYDRLQRMGADRVAGSSRGPGGSPFEELSQKVDDLRELFGEERPYDQLCRIEDRLEQLFERFQQGGLRLDSSGSRQAPVPSSPPASESFEEIRARLLAEAGAAAGAAQTLNTHHSGGAADETAEEMLEMPELPAPVGIDATPEELHQGIDARDLFISYLISRVRTAESRSFPLDWAVIAEAPEELVQQVEQLRDTLERQLREAEIAHSMERATLARDRNRLLQVKQQLEQHVRKLASGQQAEAREDSRANRLLGH